MGAELDLDDAPYCHNCGSELLIYREQYANGSEYECRDCGEVMIGMESQR